MKQILITGSFGFLGSKLALHFLKAGWKVHLLDLPNHNLKAEMLARFKEAGEYEFFETDICDIDMVSKAINGCQEVIHVAALLNSVASFKHFYRTNVQGTKTVCDACVRENVSHLTLISTSDVFGIPKTSQTLNESVPYQRWNEPYADTKIEAASYVQELRSKGLLNASIVYPGWVYGEGDRQFFPAVIEMVRARIVFTWHKTTASDIYFLHIDDLIGGVDKIIRTPAAANRDYLLLDPKSGITPLSLYKMIAEILGIQIKHIHLPYPVMMFVAKFTQTMARLRILPKPILSSTDVKAFGNRFQFSINKAQTELQWTPKVTSSEGILRALEWQTQQLEQAKM